MDNNLQTTFVPRRPIIPTEASLRTPKSKMGLFMMGAILIFVLAILAYGGLFFYRTIVEKENEDKKVAIQEAINKFDPNQLTLLRSRLDTARQLLVSHAAFTSFLKILQQDTVQTVRFTVLNYAFTSDNQIVVIMKGESNSYSVIAYQSDVLAANEDLREVTFSNLAISETGKITFDIKATMDIDALSYSKTVDVGSIVSPDQEIINSLPIVEGFDDVPIDENF